MNPDLESLLKAWDAYLEGKRGLEAENLAVRYETRLQETAIRKSVDVKALHGAVQSAYLRWKRANDPKFPTIPPKA